MQQFIRIKNRLINIKFIEEINFQCPKVKDIKAVMAEKDPINKIKILIWARETEFTGDHPYVIEFPCPISDVIAKYKDPAYAESYHQIFESMLEWVEDAFYYTLAQELDCKPIIHIEKLGFLMSRYVDDQATNLVVCFGKKV